MTIDRDRKQELLIYLVLWGLLFTAPVLSLYIRTAYNANMAFDWAEVFMVWRQMAIFFAFFLVHDFLLAPLVVHQQRRALYAGVAMVLMASFVLYQCSTRPAHFKGQRPPMHQTDDRRPPEPGRLDDRPGFDDHPGPPEFRDHVDRRAQDGPGSERPPMVFGQHDFVAIIVFLLMLVANLGVKNYFRQRRNQHQLIELERQNLEQQLEYLKYQLNPHFLMNTLNNIHALVDIDAERAKEAVIQLSKRLRYVLYESNHERVSLANEMEFMRSYTDLMRMRYGDKLQFTVSQPADSQGFTIAPLLFIAFVENAFKHGVSYQRPSFIDIAGKHYKGQHGEERLLWTCRNSKHPKTDTAATPRQGGVGLTNIRRRLDLIYGDRYTLGVNDTDDLYEVILDIPLNT